MTNSVALFCVVGFMRSASAVSCPECGPTHDVVSYHHGLLEQHMPTHDVVTTHRELSEIPEQHVTTHDVVTTHRELSEIPDQHVTTHDVVTTHRELSETPDQHVTTHDVVTTSTPAFQTTQRVLFSTYPLPQPLCKVGQTAEVVSTRWYQLKNMYTGRRGEVTQSMSNCVGCPNACYEVRFPGLVPTANFCYEHLFCSSMGGRSCYRHTTGTNEAHGTSVSCVSPVGSECTCNNGNWVVTGSAGIASVGTSNARKLARAGAKIIRVDQNYGPAGASRNLWIDAQCQPVCDWGYDHDCMHRCAQCAASTGRPCDNMVVARAGGSRKLHAEELFPLLPGGP